MRVRITMPGAIVPGRPRVEIVRWAVRDGKQIELDPDRGDHFDGAVLRALLHIPGAEPVP